MDQVMTDVESQTIYNATKNEEARDETSKEKCSVILKFDDVVYKIKTKKGGLFKKKTKEEEKVILKGVTGIVEPGEMLAMLGPSGSGKTTLLTALGGRLGGRLFGTITYNGQPFSNATKRNTGFVTQDDVLYPHLTVAETLVFTALLRLPNSVTKEEKVEHAEAMIHQLGLTKCKDSIVGEGYPLYFGKGSDALQYFSNIGFAPTIAMNPADFLLDLANGVYTDELNEDHVIDKPQLVTAYKSNIEAQLKAELQKISDFGCRTQGEIQDKGFRKWPTSWSQQFFVLLRRYLKEKKYEPFSFLRICHILLTALLAGLLWYKSNTSHLQDQIGLLFFLCGFWSFIPLYQAIHTFPEEVMMLEKERSSGMYRLSSYFMSRMVAELPMELILPAIFLVITYWMAGLKANVVNFLYTLLSLLLHVLVCQGIGLAIGAIVLHQKSATTLASVIMLCFTLAAGFYVRHMPKFIAWVKYISNAYYTYQLLIGSQYHIGETYPCSNGQCPIEEFPTIKEMGFPDLHFQALAALVLVIMLIGYRLVAYFALMRVGVTKKLT
ncbi:hypothetical protein RIF29_39170 [Crotalaria pallida]|uniref:ABC transporter domain-containing protein n=1 Tax=Crotalaria pallida TaxID=3830 RepID=A0AAN9HM85_CROPI